MPFPPAIEATFPLVKHGAKNVLSGTGKTPDHPVFRGEMPIFQRGENVFY